MEFTVDQAIEDVALVCEKFFVGKKEEHLYIEKCIAKIVEAIDKSREGEDISPIKVTDA